MVGEQIEKWFRGKCEEVARLPTARWLWQSNGEVSSEQGTEGGEEAEDEAEDEAEADEGEASTRQGEGLSASQSAGSLTGSQARSAKLREHVSISVLRCEHL
ncbi:MAG: hypothetical protein SGPRY_002009 [Prymnesium sp.]